MKAPLGCEGSASAPDLKEELRRTFADGGRVAFNLAPPILNAKGPDGRPLKREFSARWMGRLFPVLAAAKGLRGTLFDPFGLTKERKQERALIAEYEDLVALVLGALTPDNHASAVALLALADTVRGYGPVKEAAIAAYQAALPGARRQFLNLKGDRAAA